MVFLVLSFFDMVFINLNFFIVIILIYFRGKIEINKFCRIIFWIFSYEKIYFEFLKYRL